MKSKLLPLVLATGLAMFGCSTISSSNLKKSVKKINTIEDMTKVMEFNFYNKGIFYGLDTNNDGKIDTEYYYRIIGRNPETKAYLLAFDGMRKDINNNGKFDNNEDFRLSTIKQRLYENK